MTQPPNDDQELEQDIDVDISEPSPDAAYHDHAQDKKGRRSSWLVVSIGALVISGILAGIIYLAYMKGIEYGQDHVPPLITADDSLIKVPPEANEADNRFENGDLHIYDVITGNMTDKSDTEDGTEMDMGDSMGEATATPSDDMVLQDKESVVEMEIMDETPLAEAQTESMSEPMEEPMEDPMANSDDFVSPLAGAYAVQISSVRSIEQAEITYGTLQQRFPVLLASREPMVQRADLGERGIFFRLAITGFATRPAAEDFCDALKEGGQDCFVRKIN